MEIRAKGKYLRISPPKARLIIDNLKNKKAEEVQAILKSMPQKTAFLIDKLINSAIANAENNYSLKKDGLILSQVIIEEGPVYKRMKPRARGARDIIKKRTSHITVVLTSEESTKANIQKDIRDKVEENKTKESKTKPAKVEPEEIKAEKEKKPKKEEKPKKKEAEVKQPGKKVSAPEPEEQKKEAKKTQPEIEKKPLQEKKPFFQRFFRRKGGM